ncbi:MAG: alpha/beta fold hydrolase, partial [Gaiellaceae bacterium]
MQRLVLVHGSVVGGRSTWGEQVPLGERYELLIVDRPGFPPNPLVDRVDFESDADLVAGLLRPGDHLVGHSYGGVISLLAAALRPDLVRSLTVIEPPATRVALDNPAVASFAARGVEVYATAQTDDPETFLRRFLAAVGSA